MHRNRAWTWKGWRKIEEKIVKFKAIKENTSAKIIEKKSKFIANVFYVESIEEAEQYIKDIKKEYHDAKHNCFAYAIETPEGGIAVKYNDDGEPQGTAGAPILKLILEKGLSNILVIVTRYFGGILLGTGGLVRAYTEAAKKALESTKIIEKEYGIRYWIEISYSNLKEIQYICKQLKIEIVNLEYKENVIVTLESNKLKKERLENSKINIIEKGITSKEIIIKV